MSPEGTGYRGRANLAQADRIVTIEIGITVVDSMNGASHQWRGWYKTADLDQEPQGGPASITLENGSSGVITVTRALTGTGEGTFTGVDDPPATDQT
jgi:hypothetical protein